MATKNPRNNQIITRFGDNVRKYRNAKGLTMNELAGLCDVELGAISTVERGKVNCTISTAYAISKALEVSIDKLLEE
ncbi:helix-turn-helix domain-containing protein [Pedobacter rhodius]|uniref:Helix-turn-helix transcriptional regulator n=1 Tax=Pedobacter rhodius TaxID=3004098 RepID=A0ABT4KX26_9SPHI|nr:helix-turn-helix transcriptional regulator [Pedobacter sp. SJ11]MCZ4223492.1 helix-turn-helix transcriptional regulator [Pedobacter sp. SJ11]